MGKNKVRILYKEINKKPVVMEIDNTLEAKQKLVGGLIEFVSYQKDMLLVCNEEGKLRKMPINCIFPADYIAGNFFVIGDDPKNGDFKSLTLEQIKRAKEDLTKRMVYTFNKDIIKELNKYQSEELDFDL